MTEAKIIDGKAIADATIEKVAKAAAAFKEQSGAVPGLATVLVGENPASAVYVRNKGRVAERVGFHSIQKTLPADVSEAKLVALIEQLNDDSLVNGILVQLPLPDHVNESKIIELIKPEKDVDGFHPINVGRLGAGQLDQALIPCTPAGSVILAKSALGENLSGLNVLIIGRSNIVGKPAAQLFLAEHCTVTIAHSRTKDMETLAKSADILVAAVGRPLMVQGNWIKPGATVIDVGINRVPAPEKGEGKTKLVGDVDFEAAKTVAGAITPVPGGVGPMTIALLMHNTLVAACRQNGVAVPASAT